MVAVVFAQLLYLCDMYSVWWYAMCLYLIGELGDTPASLKAWSISQLPVPQVIKQ
jgi:hypothetical protein